MKTLKEILESQSLLETYSIRNIKRIVESYSNLKIFQRKQVFPQKEWVPLHSCYDGYVSFIFKDNSEIFLKDVSNPDSIFSSQSSNSIYIEYPSISQPSRFRDFYRYNRYKTAIERSFINGEFISILEIKEEKEEKVSIFYIMPGAILYKDKIAVLIATKEPLYFNTGYFRKKGQVEMSSAYGIFISEEFKKDFPNFFQSLWKNVIIPMIKVESSVFFAKDSNEIEQYFYPRKYNLLRTSPRTYTQNVKNLEISQSFMDTFYHRLLEYFI